MLTKAVMLHLPPQQLPQSVSPQVSFVFPTVSSCHHAHSASPLFWGELNCRKWLQQRELGRMRKVINFPDTSRTTQTGLGWILVDTFDFLAERMRKRVPTVETNPSAQLHNGRPNEKDSGRTLMGIIHAQVDRKSSLSTGNICSGVRN